MGCTSHGLRPVQVLGSFDPACPFPSLMARADSVWVRCESCKKRRKKTQRLLIHCASFGSTEPLQPWSQGGKPHKCINSLLSHQITGFMGLFSFQNSKLSWFWKFTNILCWIAPLFYFFFFLFMVLTLKWIVQSSTCAVKRGPHSLECLLHPQNSLSFWLPQIQKDCFFKRK